MLKWLLLGLLVSAQSSFLVPSKPSPSSSRSAGSRETAVAYPWDIQPNDEPVLDSSASSSDDEKSDSSDKPQPKIWPLPSSFSFGSSPRSVGPSTKFFKCIRTPPILETAFQRYLALTFPHGTSSDKQENSINELQVSVDSTDESVPQLETDESYTLQVPQSGPASLHAKTPYGALRGLETFSQLVTFDFDTASYVINEGPWKIEDSPRFAHRGLMIDTSRHFLPVSAIKATIDALPYAKLNVLHWHMSDSPSFPLQSKSRVKLWQGSWSPSERYLQTEVADIIEYARLRGVRVMLEIDMPGHAASWCKGYPEVCPSDSCRQPLNVASNATFELVSDLLLEMTGRMASKPGLPSTGLFKDNFVHLGGDEVNTSCWTQTPSIKKWLDKQNMSAKDGYKYFVERVAEMALSSGHRPVQWSEVYDNFQGKLNNRTVIHVWKTNTDISEVISKGFDVLLNVGYVKGSWYLDNIDVPWKQMYWNEPCGALVPSLCQKVLGGHGEMWGEKVDVSTLEQTVWPRMAAIAERLWSPREINSVESALPRIQWFRCFLNSRGVKAGPILNKLARTTPEEPGSCFHQ